MIDNSWSRSITKENQQELLGLISHICEILQLNTLDKNLVIAAVSEIIGNVTKHANHGLMNLAILDDNLGIKVVVEDTGPGIENMDEALKDGFSSVQNSLGLGLGVAKRAMDFFSITNTQRGLIVHMEKWLPISKSKINYTALSLADQNYNLNGDGYVFKEFKGKGVFTAVIDGLGQGLSAWRTTEMIKKLIIENFMLDFESLIHLCEKAIKKHHSASGICVALARITQESIEYVGIGDTFIKIYNEQNLHLNSQSGIVGAFPIRTIKVQKKKLKSNATIVMCTDGIQDRFSKRTIPLQKDPLDIAHYILNSYRRDHGDATVAVIKTNYE